MSTNRHAVVRGVDSVGVVQLPHLLELLKYPTDLDVDVLAASELSAISLRMVRSSRFSRHLSPPLHRHRGMAWSKGAGNQLSGKGGCFGLAGGSLFWSMWLTAVFLSNPGFPSRASWG